MRQAQISRKTKETEIELELNLDGSGIYNIDCNINFFKHMLEQFAYHSSFDLSLKAKSLDNDSHHLVEDVALALGSAFNMAIGDKIGINRYGQVILPMDDALVLCATDLSGRCFSKISAEIREYSISDFPVNLLPHFFSSFAQNALMTIHLKQIDGCDSHHIVEAMFKAFAKSLKSSVMITESQKIPSTKGIL